MGSRAKSITRMGNMLGPQAGGRPGLFSSLSPDPKHAKARYDHLQWLYGQEELKRERQRLQLQNQPGVNLRAKQSEVALKKLEEQETQRADQAARPFSLFPFLGQLPETIEEWSIKRVAELEGYLSKQMNGKVEFNALTGGYNLNGEELSNKDMQPWIENLSHFMAGQTGRRQFLEAMVQQYDEKRAGAQADADIVLFARKHKESIARLKKYEENELPEMEQELDLRRQHLARLKSASAPGTDFSFIDDKLAKLQGKIDRKRAAGVRDLEHRRKLDLAKAPKDRTPEEIRKAQAETIASLHKTAQDMHTSTDDFGLKTVDAPAARKTFNKWYRQLYGRTSDPEEKRLDLTGAVERFKALDEKGQKDLILRLKKGKLTSYVKAFLKAVGDKTPNKSNKKKAKTKESIGEGIQSRMKRKGETAFEAKAAIQRERKEAKKRGKKFKRIQTKQERLRKATSKIGEVKGKLYDLFGNDNLTARTFNRTITQAGIPKDSKLYASLVKEFLPKFRKGFRLYRPTMPKKKAPIIKE